MLEMPTMAIERAPVDVGSLSRSPLPSLPEDVLPFIWPSRYCEADRFVSWSLVTIGGCLAMVYITATSCPLFTDYFRAIGATGFHFGLLGGLPMQLAVGTSLLVVMMKSIAGLLGYILKFGGPTFVALNPETKFTWSVILVITVFAVAGSFAGAALSGKMHPDRLRKGFGLRGQEFYDNPEAIDVPKLFREIAGDTAPFEVISVGRWTARNVVADRYQVGRVFFAGDAAHLNHPASGLGLNTGLGGILGLSVGFRVPAKK